MTLTEPHRTTVREKLRPVIADDQALDALMSQFPASPSDAPATRADLAATEASLDVKLAQMESRLTEAFRDSHMRLMAILLSFTTAYMAIVIAAVAALR